MGLRLEETDVGKEPPVWRPHAKTHALAAGIKAAHRLSIADARIAVSAILLRATLVHKDPKFEPLDIPEHRLPYK